MFPEQNQQKIHLICAISIMSQIFRFANLQKMNFSIFGESKIKHHKNSFLAEITLAVKLSFLCNFFEVDVTSTKIFGMLFIVLDFSMVS